MLRMWIQNEYILGAEHTHQVVTWNILVLILVKNVDTILGNGNPKSLNEFIKHKTVDVTFTCEDEKLI